ncbi:MAG: tetratricopeptide repeat protein [Acidobacteria bacterium]|nr:tetratricopeptide repeat protein [Acidobacteriota bacterium]
MPPAVNTPGTLVILQSPRVASLPPRLMAQMRIVRRRDPWRVMMDGVSTSPLPFTPSGQRWARGVLVAAAMGGLWWGATALAGAYHSQQASRAASAARSGQVLTASGRLEDAAAQFRNAVALQPDRTAYRLALARALISLERFDEAERYLQDVLRADATNGEANLALARVQQARDRDAEAEASYYRAIYGRWMPEAEATRQRARLDLIELLGRTADRERVRAELTQLASAFPGDRNLQLVAGRRLLDSGFPEEAARVYRGMAERFTDSGAAHAGLAEAALALGDYAGAAQSARRALAADPSDRASAARLALAGAVDGLDPNRPRISARERGARTRRLLDLARARLENCWGHRTLTPGEDALAARLRARRPSPVTPQVLDDEYELLESAARAVAAACPAPTDEEPLDVVLRIVAEAGRR